MTIDTRRAPRSTASAGSFANPPVQFDLTIGGTCGNARGTLLAQIETVGASICSGVCRCGAGQNAHSSRLRMNEQDMPNVLAVGARLANLSRAKTVGDVSEASLAQVDTAREALALLRVVPFDLVAVGDAIGDATAVQFAQRLHRAKPWQKWLMVTDEALDAEDETTLRSLGAIAVLDGPDAWHEVVNVARRLRRSRPETTVPGLRLEPATT